MFAPIPQSEAGQRGRLNSKAVKLTKIFYFSGTGNTLWSAKKIAENLNDKYELINIGKHAQNGEIIIEADTVILIFPAYAYGAPLLFQRFVEQAIFKTSYLAVFVTYGTSPGGALAGISRILKRKKTNAAYFGRIPAMENYIAIFGPPKPETLAKRLAAQKKATGEAARAIIEKRENSVITFRPLSAFVFTMFSIAVKIFYKWYKVSGDCNGCGICEKICPAQAITMQNRRPLFSRKCEHCNGCLNWCPQKAIHFGRLNSRSPRYHHPEITATEIARHS